MLRLSKDEQKLIEFARDEFGESIVQFLLAGLGEEEEAHRWAFVVAFTDESGTVQHRGVNVEADDLMPEIPTYLPRGREPLVMLALLRVLICDRTALQASLYYDQEEVLSFLGWEDTAEGRRAIDEAVERYSFLNYRWALSQEELDARGLSFYRSNERFVSGYGHGETSEPEEGRAEGVTRCVDFNAAFISDLMKRSLFGIDWYMVSRVERETIR